MKKRIFIGSSLETKELAYKLQQNLSEDFDCVLWYEGFFSIGNHFFVDLIQKIITFDYAIMIGGMDDFVTRISTNDQKKSPRDNIYLEYGLFSGILSPQRVLLLMDQRCLPASDLAGISLAQYSDEQQATQLVLEWIQSFKNDTVITRKNIELLPTVGIAVGYYYNFIKPFIEKISVSEEISTDYRLHICIPNYVCNDPDYYKQELIAKKQLTETVMQNYRILVDSKNVDILDMYDIPSTMLTLFKTVDYIFGIHDGNNEDTVYAKQKAINNFYDNLKSLVYNDYKIKNHIEFEFFM